MMQSAIDKLRELRALHEDGLLSRAEFDSRKNAILDAAYAAGEPGVPAGAGTEIGLMTGQEVGPPDRRYRLERLIAEGGMGQVWQATDLATHAELGHSARVAIKILPPELTEQNAWAKLLVEEAARARQLAHQNIVRVYDWARDPATSSYFIIMECLEGEDLDSLLAREGRLAPSRALQLLAPLAGALDYAWERHHLVHRDIKPANVFRTRDGDIKLLDFGIAARARASAALEAPASSGTAGYRAPSGGRDADPPGRGLDVYATAVTFYQLVAGAMPFAPRRAAADAALRLDGLSEAQWAALQDGFAWEAGARPASVRDLLERLRAGAVSEAELRRAAALEAEQREQLRAREQEERERQAREQAVREQLKARLQAEATAAAKAALDRQRREQEKLARAAAEQARLARKEELGRQLAERRALEAEKARQEREEAERKAAQVKAAAAYLAEQKRLRAEQAARSKAEQDAAAPAPAPASASAPVQLALPVVPAPTDTEGLLRDRFLDGSGKGPELVLLPTGRFQMGSPDHERRIANIAGAQKAWLARELPQHWVAIERPVAMGRYPVTVGEWRGFVRASGWRPGGEVDWEAPGFAQDERHPVVGISWFDAIRYVRWLSESTGKTYRLPSEAEWEYACRAGTKTAFSFGDTITGDEANYDGNFTYNGGPRGPYRRGTSAVGSYPANAWGLFDMHGNVWEWVQDVLHDNYEGAPLDGSAWEEGGDQARRILRGGSWLYNPRYLRSALRNGFSAVLSNDIVGFRVVREL
jgi:formylglycine-generating enzyme required for sulfatase activity